MSLCHSQSAQTTDGIICSMSHWIQEYLTLEMTECSTLSDCELRQWSELVRCKSPTIPSLETTVHFGSALYFCRVLIRYVIRLTCSEEKLLTSPVELGTNFKFFSNS